MALKAVRVVILLATIILGGVLIGVKCIQAQTPPQSPAATAEPADRQTIMKLLSAMRTDRQIQNMKTSLAENVKNSNLQMVKMATLSEAERERATVAVEAAWKKFAITDDTSVMQEIAEEYGKNFSAAEIKVMTEFYQSPAGQHLLDIQQQLMQEAFRIGIQWAQTQSQQVFEELQKEFPNFGQSAPAVAP